MQNELHVGDYIKCNNETDLLNTHEELEKAGIEVDFCYQRNGEQGYWLEVKNMTETMMQIKRICAERNITQSYIADETGYTQATVSRWFNGSRTPSIRAVERMAGVLGRKVDLVEK